MNYVIMLAGGTGTRFWPLSRAHEPKQLMRLASCDPMLADAVKRMQGVVAKKQLFVASNMMQKEKISRCLQGLGLYPENIFFEPNAKSTLAPIAVLSQLIYMHDKEAVIAVIPCDHYAKKTALFQQTIRQGMRAAQGGYIVTIGMKPHGPETGYGYIKAGVKLSSAKIARLFRVERMIEKPNQAKAQKLIAQKHCFWNGGIFIFQAATLMHEIRHLMPRMFHQIGLIKNRQDVARIWKTLPSISIDYAIMEKSKKLAVIAAEYGWIDVGSWRAIEGMFGKDNRGNITKGITVDIGSSDSIMWGKDRLIATLGLRNTLIVDTSDALLVCAKDRFQDIKKLVGMLQQKKSLRKFL
ncbi:MAG: mannose-1-phosphate guanylyltransferase [Candidatus Omnitrophica bacterium]|nr:mannose-1-phosphate guanylyltransferase [Candidatus Omnitrophota bacterium]